ncbi:MAG: ATP:cob(I)alamin adenosyltransferase, partial [Candidatus Dadabacteria bacterium]|nr:ATP:cob(I)alamin adenosyltransferase [Candidatus Dadabacteria bacterium]
MVKKRITKVYTKTGDQGLTSLVGGARVSKASLRVDSYGDVDELNAVLGIILSQGVDDEINSLLIVIQNDLFIMGADLASPPDIEVPRISKESFENLEVAIDKFLEELE